MRLWLDFILSPLGDLQIVSDGVCVRALFFEPDTGAITRSLRRQYGEVELLPATDPGGATSLLRRYFDGQLDAIDQIPVAASGTEFQQKVWNALREIPAGKTRTYGELAVSLGNPAATRAVGAANGANPIGIIVPCHRVIGSSGSLTGYAGGIERKRWLLLHEGALLL